MSPPRATLLLPRYLLPVRPAQTVLERHAVRVVDGAIDTLLPWDDALRRFPDDERVELPDHVLMPGLVNMHTHSPMTLLRGYADDLALEPWLREHIWPAEQRWVSPEFVRDGTRLALAEMLRGGVTCFNEMYFFPEVIAQTTEEAGLRAVIGVPVIDVPTPWAKGIDECLGRARELLTDWADSERIDIALAPHAPYTVDDTGLAATVALAGAAGALIAMHVLEAPWEVSASKRQHGLGTLERLEGLGLLGERFIAVHAVQVDDDDIERLARTGTQVVHCPESNLKLASGVSPVPAMLEAGVNVAIGTDGAASNNNLDLLGEARTAALLAKGVSGNPEALGAWQALEMMTINGARALGRASDLGSIEPGKRADLAAMDLAQPETQPLHEVHAQLIYSASSRQFTDVWVDGQRRLADGVPVDAALRRAAELGPVWQSRLQRDEHPSESARRA